MRTTTAVLYARCSSPKQSKASIDDQLRVCREFCAREGIEVLKSYADYALSSKASDRPQFQQLIASARESDCVVVCTLDRISRDRDDFADFEEKLRECGVRLLAAFQ